MFELLFSFTEQPICQILARVQCDFFIFRLKKRFPLDFLKLSGNHDATKPASMSLEALDLRPAPFRNPPLPAMIEFY